MNVPLFTIAFNYLLSVDFNINMFKSFLSLTLSLLGFTLINFAFNILIKLDKRNLDD